jgi:hypothetical protein
LVSDIRLVEGVARVWKYCLRTAGALKRLVADKDGTVSFEYVLVAAAIIGAVVAAFGTAAGNGPLHDALANALNTVVANFKAAVGA